MHSGDLFLLVLSLGLSVSVCQSVCLGRAGRTDERAHDVNDALYPGRRHRRRTFGPKPYQFFLSTFKKHQKPSQNNRFQNMEGSPHKLKLIKQINPAAFLRFTRSIHNASAPSARAD